MSLSPSAAVAWWRELRGGDAGPRSQDRASLARLRRCATVAEAMREPAAIDLFRRCGGRTEFDLPKAALLAAVLSHVREDAPEPVARTAGPDTPDKPETALLKPLRFRRLMEAEGEEELLTVFRRLVALLGGRANVEDLAWALLYWTDRTRTTWTYRYWNAEAPNKETAA